jgi:hypothetical protein
VLLDPDDLSAQLEPAPSQVGGDDVAVQSSVPDIGDIPGEQLIGLTPVGAIVVEHLALRELAGAEVLARAPGRFVADSIRRIGDHQVRLRGRQHGRDVGHAGAVAAANPVVPQQPYVAEPRDRLIGYLRNAVGIRQTARSQTRQDGLQLIRLEADQANVEAGKPELLELVAELLEIPARPRRQLIVGQPVATLLRLTPTARDNHRDRRHPSSWSCSGTRVAGEQVTLLVDQHRHRPSPFADGGGKLVEVGLSMKPGIVRVGY